MSKTPAFVPHTYVYILGPMRGIQWFNFKAFDEAAEKIDIYAPRHLIAVSPAQIDRDGGFNPYTLRPDWDWTVLPPSLSLDEIIDRDIEAVRRCKGFVRLPGWEKSSGARAEYGLLKWQQSEDMTNLFFKPGQVVDPLFILPAAVEPSGAKAVDSTNPKDLIGCKKPNIYLVPPTFITWLAKVMENGAKKYGPYNWRGKKVRSTIYISAAMRHLMAYLDGENLASDSKLPHLAHAAASLGILIDAEATGNLIDDRPLPGKTGELIDKLGS